ncbi:histidine kinase dimerization/phosphoacceptor domain -containing protein [Caballeronia sp. GAFFF2]|jgi:PAS domain S-box-containing protein|uniref:sensor histidine kinase n=1 Tax=Caballeronia sp. GAFFF2 TaxID=2921741 RepID=UPI0020282017|nr:histidine kinase dimerization/phosphoacceptor domain -containing protein [Caballeronia sp. GAFFF2]
MAPNSQRTPASVSSKLVAQRLRKQQELAVAFGATAFGLLHFPKVLDEACRVLSEGMNAKHTKVLRYVASNHTLIMTAGIGWDDEDWLIPVEAEASNPAGAAFLTRRIVVSGDIDVDKRFNVPPIMARHGLKSAINVPIQGMGEPFGILEVDSTHSHAFADVDAVFISAIANIISFCREQSLAEDGLGAAQRFSPQLVGASSDCVLLVTTDGKIEFANEACQSAFAFEEGSNLVGAAHTALWHDDDQARIAQAVRAAIAGKSTRVDGRSASTIIGDEQSWDVSISPVLNEHGAITGALMVLRNITEWRSHEDALVKMVSSQEARLEDSALAIKEVHHRVRNSLQLVQTLLSLQASLAADATVKHQLQAAATRVDCIGSVHERLYSTDNALKTDAQDYLSGVVDHIAELDPGRSISVDARGVSLSETQMTTLGLVVAEMTMNALKYGRGHIHVGLTDETGNLTLVVEDEGNGFPENFPTPSGTGLGMRLIQRFSGASGGSVRVDRSVSFSRLVVTFTKR